MIVREQNKFMISQTTTPKTHYRSIKYRLSKNISAMVNKTQNITFKANKRYSSTHHHHHKIYPHTKVKTMANIQYTPNNNQQQQLQGPSQQQEEEESRDIGRKFGKSTYIDSYNDILSLQSKRKEKKSVKKGKKSKRVQRILLPTLVQNQSLFSMLTNINQPIIYIKQEIQRTQSELAQSEKQMRGIKRNYTQIQTKINKQIKELQTMAQKGFHKLNKLLKSTMTFQQQITVNSKNEINSYHHFLSQLNTKLSSSKSNTKHIQINIFANMPYELQPSQEHSHHPQPYF